MGLPRTGDRDGFGPDDGLLALTVGEDAPAGEDDVGILVVDVRMHADVVALLQCHEAYFLDGLIVGGRFPLEGEPVVECADPCLADLLDVLLEELVRGEDLGRWVFGDGLQVGPRVFDDDVELFCWKNLCIT